MAESSTLLPLHVLRALPDKLYEKRKHAAHEVELEVKRLVDDGNQERIGQVIELLANDFALSSQANHRKGGLIGLAAVTVGLGNDASQYLESIVPAVLRSFSDPDSRVRYYACEALYNIAKVTRGDFIVFFNDVFDALCKMSADPDTNVQSAAHLLDRLIQDIVTGSDQFSVEEFVPLLRERMSVVNQKVQQFLVGWIRVLDSVPDIDMLSFLPDFLDGLFSMLGDSAHEIRVQADHVLRTFLEEIKQAPQAADYGRMTEILVQRVSAGEEFTRLTAITWITEFVKLGGIQLLPYYAAILGVVLPCIADKEEKIQAAAKETSALQMGLVVEGGAAIEDTFDIPSILEVMRRELGSDWDATRLEALSWIACLLHEFPDQVLDYLDNADTLLYDALLSILNDTSNEVVLMALSVQASIGNQPQHFHRLLLMLLLRFNSDRDLLERRGSLVIRHLSSLLDPEKVFRELAFILQNESDCDFAATMIQALNLILVAAPELADVRDRLKRTSFPGGGCRASLGPGSQGGGAGETAQDPPRGGAGRSLFLALFPAWSHSPVAAVTLCLLAQSFDLASTIMSSLDEADMTVSLMVQMDKLVQMLETPVFSFLRLKLLDPTASPHLLQTLYSLLMLLPQQSLSFKVLRTRLKCVPPLPPPASNLTSRRTSASAARDTWYSLPAAERLSAGPVQAPARLETSDQLVCAPGEAEQYHEAASHLAERGDGPSSGVSSPRGSGGGGSVSAANSRQRLLEEVLEAGGNPARAAAQNHHHHRTSGLEQQYSGPAHSEAAEDFAAQLLKQYKDVQKRQRLFRDPSGQSVHQNSMHQHQFPQQHQHLQHLHQQEHQNPALFHQQPLHGRRDQDDVNQQQELVLNDPAAAAAVAGFIDELEPLEGNGSTSIMR